MNRNFERFEIGHWYIYMGDNPINNRNRRPISFKEVSTLPSAVDLDNWIEVCNVRRIWSLGDGDYFYNCTSNTVQVFTAPSTPSIGDAKCFGNSRFKLIRPPFQDKPKFSVGHKVKVKTRDELIKMGFVEINGSALGKEDLYIVSGMLKYLGQIVTIKDLDYDTGTGYNCTICECAGKWHTDWFEPVDKFEVNIHSSNYSMKDIMNSFNPNPRMLVIDYIDTMDINEGIKTISFRKLQDLAMDYSLKVGNDFIPKYQRRKAKLKAEKSAMQTYMK